MIWGFIVLDQETAIKLLKGTISQIEKLKLSHRLSKEHTKWLTDTLYLLEEIFGRNSKIFINFAHLTWQARGSFIIEGLDIARELKNKMREGYLQDLETGQGLIESGIDLIGRKGIDAVYEGKDTPAEASEILKIVSLIENKLRKVIRERPSREKGIQEALESLFIGAGLDKDFTREKEHILYSDKTYVPDFVFHRINTIVEVKLCDSVERGKQIIAEINDDILAYKTKYANLIFVVYDIGVIRDEDQFKGSIEQHESVIVKVIKH